MTGRDLLEPRPQICSFLAKRRLRHSFMINKGGVRIAVTSLLDSLSGMTLACANTRIVFDYRRSQAGHGTALISGELASLGYQSPPAPQNIPYLEPLLWVHNVLSRAIWLH